MVVVADTTPLSYLISIEQIELLPALYDRVVIPVAVLLEINHPTAPEPIRAWASCLPAWCEVRASETTPDATLCRLDAGERYAIQLA